MTKSNKNILRSILVLSYLLLISLVIYGIGALYTYLNTGADRSKMLHTEVKQIEQYLPEVNWKPLTNKGRKVDEENLNSIENDYLDAWYVKQVVFQTNSTNGIENYYTESARENLYNIIQFNQKTLTTIESTTLEHHPKIEYFSEDGQLVVLTDYNVKEYKRLYKNKKLLSEINEVSTYKATLLLEDGFWRIRHLVKVESKSPSIEKANQKPIQIETIKGINYYPKATPWNMYGENFNETVIASDFKIIKEAGLNSIRIFVPYEDFGKANLKPEKLVKLKKVLDIAEQQSIGVMVTLFDFYGDYSVLDWSLTQQHARKLVNELKSHKALIAWDIKNEPNLDFESRNESLVKAWLDKMIDVVKKEDSIHPVTIGWSNAKSANILKEKIDFVSFHYYEDLKDLKQIYKNLKTEIPNKPIVITEFGVSSYDGFWNPFGYSQEEQANYHQEIQSIFEKQDIPFMSWTLYDFIEIPEEVVGSLPWRKHPQKYFGFIDKEGKKKTSFNYISFD